MARLRQLLSGPTSTLLVLLMLLGCLFLWIAVPVLWLWVGSQIQESASLGTALMVTMVGVVVSILVGVSLLSRVNRYHLRLQEERQRPLGQASALELIMVASVGIAVLVFGVWFLGFAGSSPLPLNIGF
jgi:uncharacterized membrane protein YbhN (UPF0104 family)